MRARPAPLRAVLFAGAAALLGAAPARADGPSGRVVDLEAPSPPATPPSSERATRAFRAFDAGRWADAAIDLRPVMAGDTGDGLATQELATFDLAISLYRLKLFQASFGLFGQITSDARHPRFSATLPWLARLAEVLPPPANVAERIGKYSAGDLLALRDGEDGALYSDVSYLLGRYEYSAMNYDGAIASLDLVRNDSPRYAEARFLAGVANVALRRPAPALAAFASVGEALAGGAPADDPRRLRDLANLSLARTHYTGALHRGASGAPLLDASKLEAALGYWGKIDATSDYWLDAELEASWAYFMVGDLPRAMGNIHTIESPYFARGLYPEADVLKAEIYYSSCRYDEAARVATSAARVYDPMRRKVEDLIASLSDDDADERFLALAIAVRAGTAKLDRDVAPIVRRALGDRELGRSLEYVMLLDRERAHLDEMTPAFRAAAIFGDVADALELAKAVAIEKAGALARERLERSAGELGDKLADLETVVRQVAKTTPVGHGTVGEGPHARASLPVVARVFAGDDEHEAWPFDGEYWRDELGSYRQEITSKCR